MEVGYFLVSGDDSHTQVQTHGVMPCGQGWFAECTHRLLVYQVIPLWAGMILCNFPTRVFTR